MADKEPDSNFMLDASVLLAKLHLAAKWTIPDINKTVFIKNAGIVDEKAEDKPEAKSNAKFDFKSGGSFEVGLFMNNDKYVFPYEDLVDGNDDEEKKANYKKIVTDAQKIDSDKIADIEKKLDEENEARKKSRDEALAKMKKDAVNYFKKYFTSFAGKEAGSKVPGEIDPIPYSLIEKFDDIEADKGAIAEPDAKALQKVMDDAKKQFEKDAKSKTEGLVAKPITMTYCFKLKFSASSGK